MKTIRLPKLLTIGWSRTLFELLSQGYHHAGPITFDFEKVEWAAPFGLTAMSIALAKCLEQKKKVFYSPPKNKELGAYLERIGFKHHFLGGDTVQHKYSSVELKHLNGVDPGCSETIVELIANNLFLSEDSKYEMRTHINELMTNGFDHSKSKLGCYVCAQWFPAKHNLRISFADGGIGIFQSLRESGKYPDVHNDVEAIRLAVKPGITTRKKQLGGFGLDYIKKYVRNNNGTLTILSGKGKVNFYQNKIEDKIEPIGFNGTIVDIKVSSGQIPKTTRRSNNDIF